MMRMRISLFPTSSRIKFRGCLCGLLLLANLFVGATAHETSNNAAFATQIKQNAVRGSSQQPQQHYYYNHKHLVGNVSAVYDMIDRVLVSSSSSSSKSKSHPFVLKLVPRRSDTHSNDHDNNNNNNNNNDDDDDDWLYFQLQDLVADNKHHILITATTASELSAGVGYYLRHLCNMTIGWPRGGGSRIVMPKQWPKIATHAAAVGQNGMIRKVRQVPWSYLMNVCTHSYSLVWYDWPQWEQFIDWLSLSGINMILALTGQEEIQYRVFQQLGLHDRDIRTWFNGPALLTWSRGQNEYGNDICGPLPRSWIKAQFDLQKRHILPRLRQLGIIGQLPAFQGNVPIQLRNVWKDANITQQGATGWMDALDPLYGKIADVYMQILLEEFGTDHWYQLDGYFNGETAPWMMKHAASTTTKTTTTTTTTTTSSTTATAWESDGEQTDSQSHFLGTDFNNPNNLPHDEAWYQRGSAVYQGLARTDPKAIWSFQGFAFIGWDDTSIKEATALKGFVDAAPPGHFVIMDMSYTGMGEWQKFHNASFFGAPFVWTALHDFGGTDGIKGDMRRLNRIPFDLVTQNTSVVGVGGTPEGIDQNPTYYDFLFESNFRTGPVSDLSAYMGQRKLQQYGVDQTTHPVIAKHIQQAWALLLQSLYSDERSVQDHTGIAHLNPQASLFENDRYTPQPMLCQVFLAWRHLLVAVALAALEDTTIFGTNNEPFRYDLVNVGREVLAQLSTPAALNFTDATAAKPLVRDRLIETANFYIKLLNDADELVSTDQAFLLGPWIESARQWGDDQADDCVSEELNSTNCHHFYEWNARTQITTWNPTLKDSATIPGGPIDYAAKHWSGLIRDYYGVRANILLDQALLDEASSSAVLNQTHVDRLFARHAFDWTTATNPYPTTVTADVFQLSFEMFNEYKSWFSSCACGPADDEDEKAIIPGLSLV